MTSFERWSNHVSNLLVGGTGVVYAVFRYMLKPADPFALVNHPLQPFVQHAHVVVAPLLVFATGLVWQRHVAPRLWLHGYPRRTTGLAMVFTLVPMIASGYLLQVATEDTWRKAWIAIHLTASVLWLLGYLVHQLSDPMRRIDGRRGLLSLFRRPRRDRLGA
jgi:hypothetical protein